MKFNSLYNFDDYSYSLNEGNSYKKDLGIIGPFSDSWGYKIRTSCPSEGGEESDSIIMTEESGDGDLVLKYIYPGGDSSFTLPIECFDITGSPNNPILQTRKNSRWWGDEENQEDFDSFIDSFLESKHFSLDKSDSADGDISDILDLFGIESEIKKVQKKKDLHWIAYLDNGSEIELKKKDNNDFLKNLKIYLSKDSYSPEIEIYKDGTEFETIFSTPKGKFTRRANKFSDLYKDPIHKYLFHSSMQKDPSLYQEPVMNYLNSILKNHDWRPISKNNSEEIKSKESEINRIKKMLTNTIDESSLDEIYSQAREKYSKNSVQTRNP
jgi:hypothetical protein